MTIFILTYSADFLDVLLEILVLFSVKTSQRFDISLLIYLRPKVFCRLRPPLLDDGFSLILLLYKCHLGSWLLSRYNFALKYRSLAFTTKDTPGKYCRIKVSELICHIRHAKLTVLKSQCTKPLSGLTIHLMYLFDQGTARYIHHRVVKTIGIILDEDDLDG